MEAHEKQLLQEIHTRSIRIDERLIAVAASQEDQEGRIRKLEKWRNVMAGLIASIASGIGIKSSTLL